MTDYQRNAGRCCHCGEVPGEADRLRREIDRLQSLRPEEQRPLAELVQAICTSNWGNQHRMECRCDDCKRK